MHQAVLLKMYRTISIYNYGYLSSTLIYKSYVSFVVPNEHGFKIHDLPRRQQYYFTLANLIGNMADQSIFKLENWTEHSNQDIICLYLKPEN